VKDNVSYHLKAALHLLVDGRDSRLAGRTKISLLKGLQLDEVLKVEFSPEGKTGEPTLMPPSPSKSLWTEQQLYDHVSMLASKYAEAENVLVRNQEVVAEHSSIMTGLEEQMQELHSKLMNMASSSQASAAATLDTGSVETKIAKQDSAMVDVDDGKESSNPCRSPLFLASQSVRTDVNTRTERPPGMKDLMEQHLVRRMALKQKRREERSCRLDGSTE